MPKVTSSNKMGKNSQETKIIFDDLGNLKIDEECDKQKSFLKMQKAGKDADECLMKSILQHSSPNFPRKYNSSTAAAPIEKTEQASIIGETVDKGE